MVGESKSEVKSEKPESSDTQSEAKHLTGEKGVEQSPGSSSTISISESTESIISLYETSAEEEICIVDNIYLTDSESQEDEEPEYVQRKSLLPEIDFFETLGEVPSVNNISVDISVPSSSIDVPVIFEIISQDGTTRDTGKFVDPLTGLDLSSESIFATHEEPNEELDEEKTEVSFKDQEASSVSDLLIPADTLDLEDEKKPIDIDDTLEVFLELQMEPEREKPKEVDWEAAIREDEAKRLKENTLTFLNQLINKVVQLAEYLSPAKILQQNLDKRKLLTELHEKLKIYYLEKSKCAFLNRQAVNYFRRKKSFRALMEESPKSLVRDKRKLKEAKEYLDQMLAKEAKLIKASTDTQEELSYQYNILKQEAEKQIQLFENLVRQYLHRENKPKMNGLIDRLLLSMKKQRQDLSEVRLSLFLQQHTKAKLREITHKLEDLGNGLNTKSFTTIQAENQTLDNKIEERNTDLNKLYLSCRNNIHTLAHYKEKQKMVQDTITIQQTILDNLTDNKRMLRERLYNLKLQRNRVQNKIKKLSLQGGLLDKPALMFDYDNTVKIFTEKKESVDNLKQAMLMTQRKFDKIAEQCSYIKIY